MTTPGDPLRQAGIPTGLAQRVALPALHGLLHQVSADGTHKLFWWRCGLLGVGRGWYSGLMWGLRVWFPRGGLLLLLLLLRLLLRMVMMVRLITIARVHELLMPVTRVHPLVCLAVAAAVVMWLTHKPIHFNHWYHHWLKLLIVMLVIMMKMVMLVMLALMVIMLFVVAVVLMLITFARVHRLMITVASVCGVLMTVLRVVMVFAVAVVLMRVTMLLCQEHLSLLRLRGTTPPARVHVARLFVALTVPLGYALQACFKPTLVFRAVRFV